MELDQPQGAVEKREGQLRGTYLAFGSCAPFNRLLALPLPTQGHSVSSLTVAHRTKDDASLCDTPQPALARIVRVGGCFDATPPLDPSALWAAATAAAAPAAARNTHIATPMGVLLLTETDHHASDSSGGSSGGSGDCTGSAPAPGVALFYSLDDNSRNVGADTKVADTTASMQQHTTLWDLLHAPSSLLPSSSTSRSSASFYSIFKGVCSGLQALHEGDGVEASDDGTLSAGGSGAAPSPHRSGAVATGVHGSLTSASVLISLPQLSQSHSDDTASTSPLELCAAGEATVDTHLPDTDHLTTPPQPQQPPFPRARLLDVGLVAAVEAGYAANPAAARRWTETAAVARVPWTAPEVLSHPFSTVGAPAAASSSSSASTADRQQQDAFEPLSSSSPRTAAAAAATPAADIYACGVLMWEWLSGRQPWEDWSPLSLAHCLGAGRLGKLPLKAVPAPSSPNTTGNNTTVSTNGHLGMHPAFAKLLRACWRSPERRPTARQLLAALQKLETQHGGAAEAGCWGWSGVASPQLPVTEASALAVVATPSPPVPAAAPELAPTVAVVAAEAAAESPPTSTDTAPTASAVCLEPESVLTALDLPVAAAAVVVDASPAQSPPMATITTETEGTEREGSVEQPPPLLRITPLPGSRLSTPSPPFFGPPTPPPPSPIAGADTSSDSMTAGLPALAATSKDTMTTRLNSTVRSPLLGSGALLSPVQSGGSGGERGGAGEGLVFPPRPPPLHTVPVASGSDLFAPAPGIYDTEAHASPPLSHNPWSTAPSTSTQPPHEPQMLPSPNPFVQYFNPNSTSANREGNSGSSSVPGKATSGPSSASLGLGSSTASSPWAVGLGLGLMDSSAATTPAFFSASSLVASTLASTTVASQQPDLGLGPASALSSSAASAPPFLATQQQQQQQQQTTSKTTGSARTSHTAAPFVPASSLFLNQHQQPHQQQQYGGGFHSDTSGSGGLSPSPQPHLPFAPFSLPGLVSAFGDSGQGQQLQQTHGFTVPGGGGVWAPPLPPLPSSSSGLAHSPFLPPSGTGNSNSSGMNLFPQPSTTRPSTATTASGAHHYQPQHQLPPAHLPFGASHHHPQAHKHQQHQQQTDYGLSGGAGWGLPHSGSGGPYPPPPHHHSHQPQHAHAQQAPPVSPMLQPFQPGGHQQHVAGIHPSLSGLFTSGGGGSSSAGAFQGFPPLPPPASDPAASLHPLPPLQQHYSAVGGSSSASAFSRLQQQSQPVPQQHSGSRGPSPGSRGPSRSSSFGGGNGGGDSASVSGGFVVPALKAGSRGPSPALSPETSWAEPSGGALTPGFRVGGISGGDGDDGPTDASTLLTSGTPSEVIFGGHALFPVQRGPGGGSGLPPHPSQLPGTTRQSRSASQSSSGPSPLPQQPPEHLDEGSAAAIASMINGMYAAAAAAAAAGVGGGGGSSGGGAGGEGSTVSTIPDKPSANSGGNGGASNPNAPATVAGGLGGLFPPFQSQIRPEKMVPASSDSILCATRPVDKRTGWRRLDAPETRLHRPLSMTVSFLDGYVLVTEAQRSSVRVIQLDTGRPVAAMPLGPLAPPPAPKGAAPVPARDVFVQPVWVSADTQHPGIFYLAVHFYPLSPGASHLYGLESDGGGDGEGGASWGTPSTPPAPRRRKGDRWSILVCELVGEASTATHHRHSSTTDPAPATPGLIASSSDGATGGLSSPSTPSVSLAVIGRLDLPVDTTLSSLVAHPDRSEVALATAGPGAKTWTVTLYAFDRANADGGGGGEERIPARGGARNRCLVPWGQWDSGISSQAMTSLAIDATKGYQRILLLDRQRSRVPVYKLEGSIVWGWELSQADQIMAAGDGNGTIIIHGLHCTGHREPEFHLLELHSERDKCRLTFRDPYFLSVVSMVYSPSTRELIVLEACGRILVAPGMCKRPGTKMRGAAAGSRVDLPEAHYGGGGGR